MDRPQFLKLTRAVAQWSDVLAAPKLDQLPELAKQAKSQYQAVDDAAVKADHDRVAAAAAALHRYLGTGKNAQAWQTFLHWNVLEAQLKAPSPSPAEFAGVLAQLREDTVGLDLPAFTNLATALTRYQVTLAAHQNANARAEFDGAIDKLSQASRLMPKRPRLTG